MGMAYTVSKDEIYHKLLPANWRTRKARSTIQSVFKGLSIRGELMVSVGKSKGPRTGRVKN